MTCDIVLCAFGQTKQPAKVNNFEADEQRVAKEVRHPLHPHYYHHVNFTLSLVSFDAMNLQIVAQGTDNGRAMEGVTDIQGSVAVEGTNGEASVPEEKANDEQAEKEAKQVQAYVCVDISMCVCLCVYPGRVGMGAVYVFPCMMCRVLRLYLPTAGGG